MRVLFLGAGAHTAGHVLDILRGCVAGLDLTLADRDLAALPASPPGRAERRLRLDVRDGAALRALMRGHDLVVNTSGPYFVLGRAIVEAAIDARCHYVDICDDWEPTLQAFELEGAARRAGVSVLLGAGASPGLTNVFARAAAGRLEHVHRIVTGWSLDPRSPWAYDELRQLAAAPRPPAAVIHFMQQLSGRVTQWHDAHPDSARPLARHTLDYPGHGRLVAHSVGHPEPVTLGRAFPGLRESINVMTDLGPQRWLLKCLSRMIDLGVLSPESAAGWLQRAVRVVLRCAPSRAFAPAPLTDNPRPVLFALAEGLSEGRPTRVAVGLSPQPGLGMARLTSVPLGLFAELMLSGAIRQRGVLTPECLDVEAPLFPRLTQHLHAEGAPPLIEIAVQERGRAPVRSSPAARP